MLRKSLIVTFAFGLMMTVFGVGLVLAEEDENITSRTISNQEAYESLMEVSDYTEAEAHEAVYGSYEAMSDVGVATIWREITYRDENVTITGHIKLRNGAIVEAAPATQITPTDQGCDLKTINYSRLNVVDFHNVRFQSSYEMVCGIFPFTETVDYLYRIN